MDALTATFRNSLVLRGILAILFGIAAVFWPGLTLVTLVYLFSAFILANGVTDLVVGIERFSTAAFTALNRLLWVLVGILQIGLGVYLLRHPDVAFGTFILLAGFMLILRGILELVVGMFEDMQGMAMFKVTMFIGGLAAIVAGVILFFQPVAGGVAFVWVLGLYALLTGPLLLALAIDVDKAKKMVAKK